MAVETRYADSNTTITAGCANVANALGAPDGTYTTNGNELTDWTERFGIGNPTNPLTTGATDHAVTVTLRKSSAGGNGNPTCAVDLYDNGTIVRSLQGATAVTDATATFGPFTFTTAEVSNAANVQIELAIVGQGGSPAGRRNVQVDAITVDFNTTASGPITVNVGQVTEADTAQAVTRRKSRAVNQATESDTVQPVGDSKSAAVNQATETDTTPAPGVLARRKRRRVRPVGAVGSVTVVMG